MAVAPVRDRLVPVLDAVSRSVGRHGVKEGDTSKSKGALRITLERDVRRIVQVYWTPFEANVPGRSIGLHLEVAEPRVHWAECYLTPEFRNWVFCFAERADGEIQLLYHRDYETPQDAIDGFFALSGWYVLTATDLTWDDVTYEVSDELVWTDHHRGLTGGAVSKALQESLKKSTILWLRWNTAAGERTMPVWYLYDTKADKIFVLSGERQQTIPDAESIKECEVIFRWKGKNARVAEVRADARALEPGPEWDAAAEKIAEKRLNIPGLPEETARRWRDECVILELTLRT